MPQIPKETIDLILDASDIVDVVSSYIPNLKRAGSAYKANCPFHNERTPSFNVTPSMQRYKCFGCGEGGDAIGFVMKYENLPFIEAVQKLAQRANIQIVEEAHDPQAEKRRRSKSRLVKLNNETAKLLHDLLLTHPDAKHARAYLKSRGYGKEMAANWLVGYMPKNSRLYFDWAKEKGYTGRELKDVGLANLKQDDNPRAGLYLRFTGRLMFPIVNDYGDTIGFSGRKLEEEAPGGKYINSPQTILFDKSKTIFGLNKARRPINTEKFALLCEGQIDAIACHEAGLENAIAPLGTAFTAQQANLLKRYTQHITLCYDGDSAGQKASARAFQELVKVGLQVKLARIPDGQDPDDYISAHGIDQFRTLLNEALPFFDSYVQSAKKATDLTQPNNLADFIKELAPLIAIIPDQLNKETNIDHLARLLNISPSNLQRAVQDAGKKQPREYNLDKNEKVVVHPTQLHRHIHQLCHLLLSAPGVHPYLNEQLESLFEAIQGRPGEHLLKTLLATQFDPSNPTSLNSLLLNFNEADQAALTPLLELSPPSDPLAAANETLATLSLSRLKSELEIKLSTLSTPHLPPAEQAILQKEILDLQAILKDIATQSRSRH